MTDRAPKKRGRTTKRTPERAERLIAALAGGNTRRSACAAAGISEDTLARWLAASADLAERVKEAEGIAESQAVETIRTAFGQSWQAAAWWLERRRPKDYARRLEVSGAEGGPVQVAARIEIVNNPQPPPE